MLKTRTTCRACGSSALQPVVSLGEQQLASNFVISKEFPPTERALPLDLVRCSPDVDENACGLVQLRHTVPGDLMYSSYGYRSGINQTMTQHLAGIAHGLEGKLGLKADDLVVDIGANDGTTLLAYRGKGLRLIGFEPSNIRPLEPTPQILFIRDYFSAVGLREVCGDLKARVVTSIAMFYDLEDPDRFVGEVAAVLAKDGLWVLEMSYLPLMLANNSFDTICHEHLEYYAIAPIERLLQRHHLRIANAEVNNANGGSIRITACRADSPFREHDIETRSRIYKLKKEEFELKLDTEEPYRAFADSAETIRRELPSLLLRLMASGKKIYGYGASTKGNVILQYCGLSPAFLTAIADRNPAKWGGSTVGSGIPIISEDEMRAAKPDYLLVLPWHFLDEFMTREKAFLAGGGRFIVPIPQVKIVG
jgi:C-methyltransferase C-terminal domain/Putative zinc binding domain/Methyltransferase domain